jgi:glycosyltransferase involved in cell wall biosynthesis
MAARDIEFQPLVSVVVPCYNAAQTLDRTLRSIASQSFTEFEVIIVDDGSIDESPAIAERYVSADRRFRLETQRNAGVARARNRGIGLARGGYIAPIDSDDIWHPQKLLLQVAQFERGDETLGLVYTWSESIDEDDRVLAGGSRFRYAGHVLEQLCRIDFVGNGSTPMMRADYLRAIGGYDESLRARHAEGCEDWKLALSMAEVCTFGVIPQPLTGYRRMAGNMSSRADRMVRSSELVAEEFSVKYPHLRDVLTAHLCERIYWYMIRALTDMRWVDAQRALTHLLKHDRPHAMRLLAKSPIAIGTHAASQAFNRVRTELVGEPRERRPFLAA